MRVAIDTAGRLVIPKALRDELGVQGPAELDLTAVDGRLELTIADVPARVEDRDGFPVIATDEPMALMTVAEAAEAIERSRR